MNKKLYRNIGIMAGILFLAAIVVALYMFYKPHRNVAKSDAAYTLSATELYRDFRSNEAEANKKYLMADKGKIIQVAGIVQEINKDAQGGLNLLIKDPAMKEGGISCSINPQDLQKAGGVKKGNNITLKGECTGYIDLTGEVTLSNCVLIDTPAH